MRLPWTMSAMKDALQDPLMMQDIARPLVSFRPIDPPTFPPRWEKGAEYRMSMHAFGLIPLGWQRLRMTVEKDPSSGTFVLRDRGPGLAVSLWDHEVEIAPAGEGMTSYRETLLIEAGLLAPLLWVSMRALFWWRERRWKIRTASPPGHIS